MYKDDYDLQSNTGTEGRLKNSAVMAGLTAILAAGMGIATPHASGGNSGIPSNEDDSTIAS